MTDAPLNEYMRALHERINYSDLAHATGRTRPTISRLANKPDAVPQRSTRRDIEEACGLPQGTISKVMNGTLGPHEAAAMFGSANNDGAGTGDLTDIKARLFDLESRVAGVVSQIGEWPDRYQRLARTVEQLASQLDAIAESVDRLDRNRRG